MHTMLISVGGFSDDPEGKSIEFMKSGGSWRAGPNLPYQVSFASAVVIGREVFVLGGEYVGLGLTCPYPFFYNIKFSCIFRQVMGAK